MEQGQSEESLIESGERSDVGRWRNTPAGELEAIAVVKWHFYNADNIRVYIYFSAEEVVPRFFT